MSHFLAKHNFEKIIDICSQQPEVKEAVLRNHDNNLWWPMGVNDWRLRMLIAGLSTRISYNMITTYQNVVNQINEIGFNKLYNYSDKEFLQLVKPLGLSQTRLNFWLSLKDFFLYLKNNEIEVTDLSNDEFIELITNNVKGAGFKVAQCCVLYVRGYYCGIMPVDSGMQTMLCPALGLPAPKSAWGYEIHRKQLEALTKNSDCYKIALKNGYESLYLPTNEPLTWWTHLVLIYYKRSFCRKHDWAGEPLRRSNMTDKIVTPIGAENKIPGVKNVIIEGLDGTGKTDLANLLRKHGFKQVHFTYNHYAKNLFRLYYDFLQQVTTQKQRFVLDRSFFSELVYGPALRGKNRIAPNELKQLLSLLKEHQTLLIFLHAPQDVLLKRREDNPDQTILKKHYDNLMSGYQQVLTDITGQINWAEFDTNKNSTAAIVNTLFGIS